MSFKKYKRLLLVLFLPLIIAGFLFTKKSLEKESYAYILCNYKNSSICTFAGITGQGGYYDMSKKESYEWFDIKMAEIDDDGPVSPFVSGAEMVITSAKVIGVDKIWTQKSSLSEVIKERLPELNVGVILGAPKGLLSSFSDKGNYLTCNSLEYTDDRSVFISNCYSQDWSAKVTYRAYGESMTLVNEMRDSIVAISDDRNFQYRIMQLIAIPMFFYIFLVGSLAAWVIVKAVKFINKADD